jgi:Carboxypeptidase regulatory-like domain
VGISRGTARVILWLALLLVPLGSYPGSLLAQASATLSGTVTDPLGETVANAKISVKNLATGLSTDTHTDSEGHYSITNLAAGAYEVSVTKDGFERKDTGVTLVTGADQTLDVALKAPASGTAEPSLQDLGFSASEVKGSAEQQALLDRRSHMLQIHQKLGLVTAGAMVAALIASSGAKGHHGLPGDPSGRNLHAALGMTTAGLYIATAYFAIRAPKVQGMEVRGPIRLHKALAYIHGPGMIMTTILGIMAYQQLSNGERVHGIARAHGAAAMITTIAFGASILSVSIKF